jgi:hypothetical protein
MLASLTGEILRDSSTEEQPYVQEIKHPDVCSMVAASDEDAIAISIGITLSIN